MPKIYDVFHLILDIWFLCSIRLTAGQCLEHPWLKRHPKKTETIETPLPNTCKTNGEIKSPLIEIEVRTV